METVKTYHQVNRENASLSFGISRMEDIYAQRKGQADTPHRHDYYTVLLVKSAKGRHIIDFSEYPLKGNNIYFIAPGQVHQVIEAEQSFGYSIVFSIEFLAKNNIPVDFIDNLNLFHSFGENPPLPLNDEELKRLCEYAHEMLEIYHSNIAFEYDAMGALLKLLLIRCNNACSIYNTTNLTIDTGSSVLQQFKTLVDKHYHEWHATNEYAAQLYISPDYLNRLVKMQTGKTAKAYIQSRIIVAAKRLLYFSKLSAKEIGYELGFSESANFSAFFKNCTGTTPLNFKNNNNVRQ